MIRTNKEFWEGVEGSYRRLGLLALSLTAVAIVANFLPF